MKRPEDAEDCGSYGTGYPYRTIEGKKLLLVMKGGGS